MPNCAQCTNSFDPTQFEKEFYEQVSPVFNKEKFQIPLPKLCPQCRQQQKLPWRNERSIYKRKCDSCEKSIISEYSPDKPHTVYCQDCFWSDNWSATDYGQDYNFSRSFNEQMDELIKKVPHLSLINTNAQNSEYCHRIFSGQNNYLSFIALYDPEELFYTHYTMRCKHSVDLTYCRDCEWSYQLVDCKKCYECFYSRRLENCSNLYFSEDCIGCQDCFGCKNLIHKSYCVYNKQYSKEDYLKFLEERQIQEWSNVSKYKKESLEFFLTQATKNISTINCENCVGTNLDDCKNCRECYDIYESEDMCFSSMGETSHHCLDCYGMGGMEYASNSITIGYSNNIHFSANVIDSHDIFYSFSCYANSANSFGSVGLRKKQYCILNKQYSKQEYETLLPKIIEHMKKTGEWGEFFRPNICPFSYNETTAQEYFPLDRVQAETKGFGWSEYEALFSKVDKTVTAEELPETIDSFNDEIVNWAIKSQASAKPFKITPKELSFYRKYKLPVPRKTPDERHLDRMKMRISRNLSQRKCDNCKKEIFSSYPAEYPGIVYCQECYHASIY